MRIATYIMVLALGAAITCAVIAIVLASRVSASYTPIRYYDIQIVPTEICTNRVTEIRVRAYVSPPVHSLTVDARWVRQDAPGFQEEPTAEFTGDELPVKIDRISPLVHISPNEPGIYKLEEDLVAEGEFHGVNRTQDFEAESEDAVTVEECPK